MKSRRTVLVVEDDRDLRLAYAACFEQRGYAVTGAASGEAGLAAVLAALPDVIVSDVDLPGMDGFEMLARLQRALGHLMPPVVFCSGSDADELEAMRRGATLFVTKPGAETLMEAVDLIVGIAHRRLPPTPGEGQRHVQ
jgi:CheY-like chemotaxis protein